MLLDDLLDGIVTRLRTIDGLDAGKFPGHQPGPHRAVVDVPSVDYDGTMGRGYDDAAVTIMVYVPTGSSSDGYVEAREYLSGHGAKSLRTALTTTATGDGITGSAAFTDMTATLERSDEPEYLVVSMTATATISGKA